MFAVYKNHRLVLSTPRLTTFVQKWGQLGVKSDGGIFVVACPTKSLFFRKLRLSRRLIGCRIWWRCESCAQIRTPQSKTNRATRARRRQRARFICSFVQCAGVGEEQNIKNRNITKGQSINDHKMLDGR